jgi:hypothetical protein
MTNPKPTPTSGTRENMYPYWGSPIKGCKVADPAKCDYKAVPVGGNKLFPIEIPCTSECPGCAENRVYFNEEFIRLGNRKLIIPYCGCIGIITKYNGNDYTLRKEGDNRSNHKGCLPGIFADILKLFRRGDS